MGPYIVRFDRPEDDERRLATQVERDRVRARYVTRLELSTGIDTSLASRVMSVLFDHHDSAGRECSCGCHPGLSTEHGGGFDCRCTWSEERLEDWRRDLDEFQDSPAAREMQQRHEDEERTIATWIASNRGVEARRTTSYAPEQWEGNIDGRSFYFRERHGIWRLELDLKPSGRTVDRFVEIRDEGEIITEPEMLLEGEVIAEGLDQVLGESPVDHLAFIVTRIREHLTGQKCRHLGAQLYCPACGRRVG